MVVVSVRPREPPAPGSNSDRGKNEAKEARRRFPGDRAAAAILCSECKGKGGFIDGKQGEGVSIILGDRKFGMLWARLPAKMEGVHLHPCDVH